MRIFIALLHIIPICPHPCDIMQPLKGRVATIKHFFGEEVGEAFFSGELSSGNDQHSCSVKKTYHVISKKYIGNC